MSLTNRYPLFGQDAVALGSLTALDPCDCTTSTQPAHTPDTRA